MVGGMAVCARFKSAPIKVDVNPHTEVNAYLANYVPKVLKLIMRVGAGVANHDEATTAANQLIHAQVVEMTAIGQVNVRLVSISSPEHLVKQVDQTTGGAGVPPLRGVERVT